MAYSRRDVLKGLGVAGAAAALRIDAAAQGAPFSVGGALVDVRVSSLSPATLRISVVARDLPPPDLNRDGALVAFDERRAGGAAGTYKIGNLRVSVSAAPGGGRVADASGRALHEITLDDNGVLLFPIGNAPLLAFGEGGPQFDRRGSVDAMRNGQGGYQRRPPGGRA